MTNPRRDASADLIIKAILENTHAVIYAKDRAGRYKLVNRRYEELFNITDEQIRDQTDFDMFPRELAQRFRDNDVTVAEENTSIEFEEVVPHNGKPHTYISLKFPYHDAAGNCIGTCGVSTDITLRKEFEAALEESEQRLRQLAEHVPECFWITDAKSGQVIYISPAYERLWQRSITELYQDGTQWIEAIHPDDRERVATAFKRDAAAGRYAEEYRIIPTEGTIRWIAARGYPVLNEQGEVYRIVGVAEDITQRRLLEQQVTNISSHERQRISNELHDSLGQQLTGLGYMAQRLANRLEPESTEQELAQELLNDIQEAKAEVKRLVRGLAPVDLDSLGLGVALKQLAVNSEKYANIPCDFEYPRVLEIDDNSVATELFRIAQEATNNAFKHSNASKITIRLLGDNGTVRLEVADDGAGLPDLRNTTGMGLRIMRYRSQLIGAHLQVSSSSTGTTVVCKLNREKSK